MDKIVVFFIIFLIACAAYAIIVGGAFDMATDKTTGKTNLKRLLQFGWIYIALISFAIFSLPNQ